MLEEQIKRMTADEGVDDHYDSDDDLIKGICTDRRARLRVTKKVNKLEDFIKNKVKPEIEAKYQEEIKKLLSDKHAEIQSLTLNFEQKLQEIKVIKEREIEENKIELDHCRKRIVV